MTEQIDEVGGKLGVILSEYELMMRTEEPRVSITIGKIISLIQPLIEQAKQEIAKEIDDGLRRRFEPTVPMSIEYRKYRKFMSRYLGNKGGG